MQNTQKYFRPIELRAEQLAQYDEQGFLVVGRILTDRGLDAMRRESMARWRAEKGVFDPDATWLDNALLVNIHHHSRVVRDFYFDGPLVSIVSQIIGPNIKAATSQLTFKLRGNTMPFGWHQDNGYGELDPYNAVSTLTALDDSDEENGCLWVVPGSHREGQLITPERVTADTKKAHREVVLEVDDTRAIAVPMAAGESLLFHCWTLHKSEGNRSTERDRRILFLRYADADAVEVYNHNRPRLGRLLRGKTRFPEVEAFEAEL